ncbi:MAG: pyridoxamine 5'-phosphate oxidase family protein [Candidatus Doudnabacteria bacterium]|nr:pyridoxamine 5'-phosphate oxidase family protein [Candidatus Doudnabacteria bacterium]
MNQEQKEKVLELLKKENLAVLSYLHGNKPRSAVIDFSETGDLEIIFTTLLSYRKYEDLKQNSNVALTFGGKNNITVQYEGEAKELGKTEFLPYLKYHIQKNPIELKFSEMLEARFFKVSPVWIRYSDYGAKPNNIFEIKF